MRISGRSKCHFPSKTFIIHRETLMQTEDFSICLEQNISRVDENCTEVSWTAFYVLFCADAFTTVQNILEWPPIKLTHSNFDLPSRFTSTEMRYFIFLQQVHQCLAVKIPKETNFEVTYWNTTSLWAQAFLSVQRLVGAGFSRRLT